MLKLALGAIGALLLFLPAVGASAAKPANQACLGKDFSGYAQAFPPFGQLITSFAIGGTPIIEGGLGAEVQGHLAGLVPEGVFPNSCND
jgi:hypothetical protein